MNKIFLSILLAGLSFGLLFGEFSQASTVIQVKNNKVLIDVEDSTYRLGERYLLMDQHQKKLALIEITGLRGDRAVARIIKGNARPGLIVGEARPSSGSTASAPSTGGQGFMAYGGLIGYLNETLTIDAKTASTTDSLSLKSTTLVYKGFIDYEWKNNITLRFVAGLHNFYVTGSPSSGKQAVCSNSSTCDVKYNYMSFEGHAQYNFITHPHRFWGSVGYVFMYATTANSTVGSLDTSNKSNSMIALQAGSDINIDRMSFIPVFYQYGLFASSSGVTAGSSGIYAGYARRF